MTDRPLLLHSLAEFRSVLLPVLDAVRPRRLVEIGGEGGLLTRELVAWAGAHGAEVHVVEPVASAQLNDLAARGAVRWTRGKSPAALAELPPFDLAVIDGDHNYHVVSGELASIFGQRAAEWPVAVLHDVGWPAARRDQYYEPEDIPPEHRHPYDYERGAVPGQRELQPTGGFRGEGAFAYAILEGGPRNGVLTAVTDLLEGRDDLELRRLPCIFGLGVVFPAQAPFAAALRELLDPLHEHDLLERLEQNRIDLFLSLLEARDRMEIHARSAHALVASLERELEAEKADNARLRLELAQQADDAGPVQPQAAAD